MPVVDVVKGGGNQNRSYSPLPEGRYDLQIQATAIGESKSGAPYLRAQCEVIESESGKYIGFKPSLFITLSEKMTWLLVMLLDAAGVAYEEVQTPSGTAVRFDTDDLVNCYLSAACTHSEYAGKVREQWGKYQPSGSDDRPAGETVQAQNTHAERPGDRPAPPRATPRG